MLPTKAWQIQDHPILGDRVLEPIREKLGKPELEKKNICTKFSGGPYLGFAAEGRQVQFFFSHSFTDSFRGTRHLPVLSEPSQGFICFSFGVGPRSSTGCPLALPDCR